MTPHYGCKVEEVDYVTHDGAAFKARIVMPDGAGPFPALAEAHGGGWCVGDRTNNDPVNMALARRGIVVAAFDFRMPPVAAYPAAVADVNFGLRWLKANAARFHVRPDAIGVMGSSSGGHLMLLSTMKPKDPRYLALSRPGVGDDASARFAVALWPVICPLGRYRYLKSRPRSDEHPVLREGIERHDAFWGDEAAMAEGSPVEALERGDEVRLPDVLYIQNAEDNLHPRADMDRFVSAYARAGGRLRAELFRGSSYDFLRADPESDEARRAADMIAAFVFAQQEARPR
jgi:acetyl esterase